MTLTHERVHLTPTQHRIIRLYIANLPAAAVAEIFGIGEGTVRGHLKDARRALRKAGLRCENRITLEKSYRREYDYT